VVPLSHKFAKQSRVGIFLNERTRSTPFHQKFMFWGVSDHFVTARKSMPNWLNWCYYRRSSLNKVASEFFAMNAPDPLHFPKSSCFGASRTVSLLHESRCKTCRTGAIIAQVRSTKSRQNFSQRTHPIHSFGPKTNVLGRFGPFYYSMKVDAKLAETVPLSHKFSKKVASEFFVTNTPDPLHWTQDSSFGAFRTVSLMHESRCKLAELLP
jgi:hypothetical protein